MGGEGNAFLPFLPIFYSHFLFFYLGYAYAWVSTCHFCFLAFILSAATKTQHMQKGQIRVQTENIFPIIKKFLYSDHDIFLRELIANAVDATQKLKAYSSAGEAKGELGNCALM